MIYHGRQRIIFIVLAVRGGPVEKGRPSPLPPLGNMTRCDGSRQGYARALRGFAQQEAQQKHRFDQKAQGPNHCTCRRKKGRSVPNGRIGRQVTLRIAKASDTRGAIFAAAVEAVRMGRQQKEKRDDNPVCQAKRSAPDGNPPGAYLFIFM